MSDTPEQPATPGRKPSWGDDFAIGCVTTPILTVVLWLILLELPTEALMWGGTPWPALLALLALDVAGAFLISRRRPTLYLFYGSLVSAVPVILLVTICANFHL